MKAFPAPQIEFRNVLSLEYLFEYWKKREGHANPVMDGLARTIGEIAKAHPELTGPIRDHSIMDQHQATLAPLFSTIIPGATIDTEIMAVSHPFGMEPVYATPMFAAMLEEKKRSHKHDVRTTHEILVATWRFVLQQLYGIQVGIPLSPVFQHTDTDGLPKFRRMEINLDFCRVLATGPVPALTDELRTKLIQASNDPGCLAELIPPSSIEFRGFAIMHATDITSLEVVSRLKYHLIEENALTDADNYEAIQALVRAALRKPDVEVHLVAYREDQVILLRHELMTVENCILDSSNFHAMHDYQGTIFGNTFDLDHPIAVNEIQESDTDPQLQELWCHGGRSVLTVPLKIGHTQVGMAVFSSPRVLGVNVGDLDTLSDILPLLALGVRRSVEALERQVQQIIQKQWTSIHPAVAWKFQQEASRSLVEKTNTAMRPIVFENVSPLYAVSDIRNSSIHRSQAILADLNQQLDLGLKVIQSARKDRALPLLDELEYRIGHQKSLLSDGLNTGDEISVMNFLRRDLEPVFPDLAKRSTDTKALVDNYRKAIHSDAQSLYDQRKDFDESVQTLNKAMAAYLDQAQAEAQAIFPHYFDKTTTDGVDHTIYIGASLAPDGKFDPLYLQNLKLWQFMTLCQIARLTSNLKPRLPVPLDMTHLIMVQDLPITIRFNNDEKRFAVDGAYNIRYEIMKKRIDKAVVKGSGERLTQPERIAIVYSQEEESRDYRRYIAFLTAKRWIEPGVEELELEDLQGIHGLKALRVTVRVADVDMPTPAEVAEVGSAVDATLRRRRSSSRARV